jgi:SAM-dependent methyltransferase
MTQDAVLVKEQYRNSANLEARIALHARFSTAAQDFHIWLFDHFDLAAEARILETGCGTGLLWQKNRERIPTGWHLTLSDLSLGMLETARAANLPARFLECDTQRLPFANDSFDAVIANHMLYHVPNLARGLSEIQRVLKPNGQLYAATNGCGHMRELHELVNELGMELPRASKSFELESGAEQLSEYFGDVRRSDFEDGLEVTEAEPLVAYVQSMTWAKRALAPELESRLRDLIAARLARDGAFHITKAAGLFKATK